MNGRRPLVCLLALLTLVVGSAAVLVRCDRAHVEADDAAIVDTELMAFLSLARAHHHEANLLEQTGDTKGAIAALRKIVDTPKPHPGQRLPETEEVLADTYARIAELELQAKDTAAAQHDVETGLLHANEPTYFRGHLLEVFGIIEESHTTELVDAGHTFEADKARAHALALLREAVDVQETVIARLLDGGR